MIKFTVALLLVFGSCWTAGVHGFVPASPKLQRLRRKADASFHHHDGVDNNLSFQSPSRLSMSDKSSMPSMPDIDISAYTDKLSNMDVNQVASNVQAGEVGQRGEAYVIGQFALIFFILIGGVPVIGDPLMVLAGPGLFLGGCAVCLLSVVDLGSDSLTPFLTPTDSGSLKQDGVYALIRHPIYSGLIAIMAGLSIVTNSADRLLLTVALYFLIDMKASMEEDYLNEKYATDYEDYMVSNTRLHAHLKPRRKSADTFIRSRR